MAANGTIRFGDEVTHDITGFSGVCVAVTRWNNGCERVTIQAKAMHDGKPVDLVTLDVEELTVTKPANLPAPPPSGGPHDEPSRRPNPQRRG